MLGLAEKPQTLKQQYDGLDAKASDLERQKAAIEQQLRDKLDLKANLAGERAKEVRAGDHKKIDDVETRIRRVDREIEALEVRRAELDERIATAKSELHAAGVRLGQERLAQERAEVFAKLDKETDDLLRRYQDFSSRLAVWANSLRDAMQLDSSDAQQRLRKFGALRLLAVNGAWKIVPINGATGFSLTVQPMYPPRDFDFEKFLADMMARVL